MGYDAPLYHYFMDLFEPEFASHFGYRPEFNLHVDEFTCWGRGLVVRTSVSDWRTFLDLCVIYS